MFPAVNKTTLQTNLKIGEIYILKKNPNLDRFSHSKTWGTLNDVISNRMAKPVNVDDVITILDYKVLVSGDEHGGSTIFTYTVFYDDQMWAMTLSEHDEVFCFEELKLCQIS